MSQHMEALARANVVRFARARLKRSLFTGELTVAEALALEECRGMRVAQVLAAQRQWGPARAERTLVAAGIGLAVTVGDLTDRQLQALLGPKPKPPRTPPADSTRSVSPDVINPCPGCGLPKYEPGPGACGLCVEEAA